MVRGACTPYEQGRHTVDQRRDVKEAKLKKLNGPIKTKRTDTIRKAIRHIWKKRASTFRTNRKRGPGTNAFAWHATIGRGDDAASQRQQDNDFETSQATQSAVLFPLPN